MPFKKRTDLSGSISSSGSSANGTPDDILVPDSQNQLRHRHAGKTGLKTLVSLDGEDVLQVLRLRAVVQEAVIANLLEAVREHKGAILIKFIQEGKVFALKLIPQDKDRKEKSAFALTNPAVAGESAAGEDAVHMDMVKHLLVPGMEHLDDARLRPRCFLSAHNNNCFT